MGHANSQGQDYSELSPAKLEYMRIEPFLTIHGAAEELSKIEAKLEERSKQLQTIINSLATENAEIKLKARETDTTV